MNEADSFAEIFRGGLPHCLLIVFSMLLICSPVMPSEFEVISMSKYDLNGQHYGSRVAAISLEARSLYSWNTSRHCVLTRLTDLSLHDFDKLKNAGGLILMLPSNILGLDLEAKELITILEQSMLTHTAAVPIYFAPYNKDLEKIIDDITYTTTDNAGQNQTALGQLIVTVSANRYHVNVGGGSIVANKNSKVPIIHGELIPNQLALKPTESVGDGQKLPVILITANLKTFGIYNDYPVNADAAVLLVLMELFSKLHYTSSMAPKYRLRFLLSDAGVLLNFQGSKKWLEVDDNALQNVEFVLCLDTITESLSYTADNALYMHVSKPPKDKTSISNFFKLLKSSAEKYSSGLTVEGVHKKINLADTKLAWEHERFSIKRYPSFTLSSVKSPRSPIRTTIFKNDESRIVEHTLNTSRIIAEALASYMYKVDPISSIFDGQLAIKEENIVPYFGVKSILHNNDVKDAFEKYLNNVKIIYDKPDGRDPEFMFYNENDVKLNVYRVKPAIFDLFLTFVIGVYLLAVFLAIQYFPRFYDEVSKLTKEDPVGQLNGHSSERLKMKSH
ncbi:BOS complex subunit NCLN [Drosophila takahashii]|uniref:BOS complex subunit NCLN n=1 Tax=Drosophila takahashii TaxID=29030 RepID=UPI001CF8D445|nr:nicalin [Drosophila takahashii]